MSYQDEAEPAVFTRPEVLIAISDAATGKILQTISLPAIEIPHPFAELSSATDTQGATT